MPPVIGRTLGESIEWFNEMADKYAGSIDDELGFSQTIEKLSRKHSVQLSNAAIVLLAAPLLEQFEDRDELGNQSLDAMNADALEDSLDTIIEGASKEPAQYDLALRAHGKGVRRALTVIREFWRHFCNIPPFCGETSKK